MEVYASSMCFPSFYILPQYTSLIYFLLREIRGFCKRKERGREGEREGGRVNKQTYQLYFLKKEEERARINRLTKNKQTYLLCFLKKGEERGGESRRRRRRREKDASSPLQGSLKQTLPL
jgi:hypothetical protein